AADKAGQIEALTADAADKAGQIDILTTVNSDLAAQVEALTADATEKAGQIEALTAANAELNAQVESLTAAGTEAAGKIAAYETEIAEKTAAYEAEITAKDTELAGRNAELALLQGAEAEQAEKIKTLAADVTANAAEITSLSGSAADVKAQADALTADIKSSVEQVLALIAEPEVTAEDETEEEEEDSIAFLIAQAAAEIAEYAGIDLSDLGLDGLAAEDADDSAAAEKAEQINALLTAIVNSTEQLDTLTAGTRETASQITEKAAAVTAGAADITSAAEDKLLVSINGEKIYESDLAADIDDIIYYYSQYGYTIDTTDEELMKSVRALALTTAIQYKLLYQKAEEQGITEEVKNGGTEEAAKAEWDAIVNDFATQLFGISEETPEEEKNAALKETLEYIELYYGYTEELYVSEYVESEILTRVQQGMAEGVEVTDDEVKASYDTAVASDQAMYEGNVAMFEYYTMYYGQESLYTPEGYRGITHILLTVDDALLSDYTAKKEAFEAQQAAEPAAEGAEEGAEEAAEPVTEEQVAAAKQAILDSVKDTVDEIKAKFEAGTAFEDLIAEYGTDPGMLEEINLTNGYSVHKDSIMWDQAFTDGAMTLEKVGDISEPVIGSYGVHILYYLRDIPAGAAEMTEEKAAEIREELLSTKQSETINTVLSQWMDEADTVYTEAGKELKVLIDGSAE
ncbi:MAG: peptidylprolyl isomerase, partial [Clostridia bacterium]|nr:peptidylprolyl isomerase [Clostridia bacterium]